MDQGNIVKYLTFLLTFSAGFCDTSTFIAANEFFSAHVTGNFIIFAYDVVRHANREAWIKLLSFPVFIVAVAAGGRMAAKTGNRYALLLAESILLLLSGALALVFRWTSLVTSDSIFAIALLIVLAMGLQNTFSRLFAKETYGPTTIMTGNVTQLSLDIEQGFRVGFRDVTVVTALKKQLVIVCGFLTGCVAGGFGAQAFGLTVVLLPGLLLLITSFWLLPAGRK